MKTTLRYLLLTTCLLIVTEGVQAQIQDYLQAQAFDNTTHSGVRNYLVLNGSDAYAESLPKLGGLAKATVMCWIKLNDGFVTDGVIMGENNMRLQVNVNGNKKQLCVNLQNQTFTTEKLLETKRWYHVAAIFDAQNNDKLVLYINGAKVKTITNLQPLNLTASNVKFTVGKNAVANTTFFNGGIDEVRVFNTALTEDQLHKMVYQEIKRNGDAVQGEIVPKNIEGLNWSSLIAYYRMDAAHNDKIANLGSETIYDNEATELSCHHTNFHVQSAPMPFVTRHSGALLQAVSQNNAIFGEDARTYPWAIFQINHNINVTANQTCLAMMVAANVTLSLTNNNKLENTWYLKLDGKIDLQDRAQLVQTEGSDLDPASIGFIERDQQGQSNLFNYNYWCAPVGSITAGNNNSFTVNTVLRDGTDAQQPQLINWSNSLNGAPTTPITLSSFWIFKFQNQSQNYANWTSVGPYGTFETAQGFTLKGCGSAAPYQNLTFIGKPNNGNITLPIAGNHMNLTGNPYPSALDADAFINANKMVTNGTLYFWEQFSTNNSHQLSDYQGGYATRNLVGGVPPVSPFEVSGLGSSDRKPERFIPVGQGFFVQANSIGGTLTFTNAQRAFIKENTSSSNPLFRFNDAVTETENLINANDAVAEDSYARIRLGFTSANNFHRQVLLGFMSENASSAMEAGYDAHNIDTVPNDLYLMNLNYKLVIEGEGYFDENLIYPLGVKTGAVETVTFTIDGTEHFDANQPIYIFDAVTNLYHDIRSEAFNIELPQGILLNRFSLRFKTDGALATAEFTPETAAEIEIAYNDNNHQLQLQNNNSNAAIAAVSMYNLRGQNVASWQLASSLEQKITLPVQDLSTGTYIVKVQTTNTEITQKIMIK